MNTRERNKRKSRDDATTHLDSVTSSSSSSFQLSPLSSSSTSSSPYLSPISSSTSTTPNSPLSGASTDSPNKKLKRIRPFNLSFSTVKIVPFITRKATGGIEVDEKKIIEKKISPASSQETEPDTEVKQEQLRQLVQRSQAHFHGTGYERYALFMPEVKPKSQVSRTDSQILAAYQEVLTAFFQHEKLKSVSSAELTQFVYKFLEKLGNTLANDAEIIAIANDWSLVAKNKIVNNSILAKAAVDAYAISVALGNDDELIQTLQDFRRTHIHIYRSLHPRVEFSEKMLTELKILTPYLLSYTKTKPNTPLTFENLPTRFNYYKQQTYQQKQDKAQPVAAHANLQTVVDNLDEFFLDNFPKSEKLLAEHQNNPLVLLQDLLAQMTDSITSTMTKNSGKLLITLLEKFGDFLVDTPLASEATSFYEAAKNLGYIKPAGEDDLTPVLTDEDQPSTPTLKM